MTPIPYVVNTKTIRDAEFIELTVAFTDGLANTTPITRVFRFSSSYQTETIDGNAYNQLGALLGVTTQQRDISSTGFDTSVSITGLDPYWIYVVAGSPATAPVPVTGQSPIPIGYYPLIKGSTVKMYRGFYDANYALQGTALRFTGLVTNYTITEERSSGPDDTADNYTIVLQCSNIKQTLENKLSGRKTNQQSWQLWNPTDTSMNNVQKLQTRYFDFGRVPVARLREIEKIVDEGNNWWSETGQGGGA